MDPKIISGIIKKGKIVPTESLPQNLTGIEVKIIMLPKSIPLKIRKKYRGTLKSGWGDPVKYQREMRKELER